ncbi:MAG: nitroreductase family protein [Tepidisphaeraceae bacterium]
MARVFDYLPKVPLSPKLLDLPTPTLTVLTKGVDALPESLQSPPQDLRTLSTWLWMAAGQRPGMATAPRSAEIYVAVFGMVDLPAGLYHFGPSEFALRKLRDGPETLALLRKGRPDLNFLATIPAALLVSTVFARGIAEQGRRGYRASLLDAGQLTADCVAAATGLGMRTMTRLRMTDGPMRELIGLADGADESTAEGVQAMVAWADTATRPMQLPQPIPDDIYTLPRPTIAPPTPQPIVLAVHREITGRGVPMMEIRPPLTELSPVAINHAFDPMPVGREPASRPMREVLTDIRPAEAFFKKAISRDALCVLSSVGFRSGTSYPLRPDGAYAGLARPLWIAQEAVGHDPGLWYHDPMTDGWSFLANGQFGYAVGALTGGREALAHASAVCAVVANLRKLLLEAGPDAYRLAHLEAGIAARRMHLAAASMGFAARTFSDHYDDPWRQFLHVGNTGWEVLAIVAVGGLPPERTAAAVADTPAKQERSAGIIGFRED